MISTRKGRGGIYPVATEGRALCTEAGEGYLPDPAASPGRRPVPPAVPSQSHRNAGALCVPMSSNLPPLHVGALLAAMHAALS